MNSISSYTMDAMRGRVLRNHQKDLRKDYTKDGISKEEADQTMIFLALTTLALNDHVVRVWEDLDIKVQTSPYYRQKSKMLWNKLSMSLRTMIDYETKTARTGYADLMDRLLHDGSQEETRFVDKFRELFWNATERQRFALYWTIRNEMLKEFESGRAEFMADMEYLGCMLRAAKEISEVQMDKAQKLSRYKIPTIFSLAGHYKTFFEFISSTHLWDNVDDASETGTQAYNNLCQRMLNVELYQKILEEADNYATEEERI